jgi:hypothetical protein
MSNQKAFERTCALLNEMIDVLLHAEETAPHSPVNTLVPAKMRRQMRRSAERLRRGEIQPRFKNLYTAEQLAGIYERTARRDEIRQKVLDELFRTGREIGRLTDEDPQATRGAFEEVFLGTFWLAKKQGPDSEAARRYRQVRRLMRLADMWHSDKRRQKSSARPHAAHDEGLIPLVPAEILDSAPPGEAVIPFPAAGADSGGIRVLMRIGVGASSWIGSFEAGLKEICFVSMMPDGKHLFVSAGGAGYILDAKSRRLVERTGREIVGVTRDPLMTLFVVNHNDVTLEAFGPNGRLWKTGVP